MKKILAFLLTVLISVGSLSSCLLLDGGVSLSGPSDSDKGGDTTINVNGGPSYENINITSNHNKNLLAASKAMLSSVSVIAAFDEYQYSYNGSYMGTKDTAQAGSGVIYKLDKARGDAYIITNYHVIYNANADTSNGISDEIRVYLYGMERMAEDNVSYAIEAVYIGGSMSYDIAVLKVSASTVLMGSNARAIDVADSDKVTILDTAIAIGNPGGNGLSATVGTVNVDSEDITVKFETKSSVVSVSLRVMRTDAAVNSGNSGGGLFNDSGELIGIVNAKDADTSVDNIGYAIPSNVAIAIAENAIYYSDGTIKRCLLGITVGVKEYSTDYDLESGKIHKIEKVVIRELSSDSSVRGYLEAGDVINSITVDGAEHKVTRIFHVVDSMLYARAGSSVVINKTSKSGINSSVTVPITASMVKSY